MTVELHLLLKWLIYVIVYKRKKSSDIELLKKILYKGPILIIDILFFKTGKTLIACLEYCTIGMTSQIDIL